MTPHEILEKYFGFREFLDAQEEVISAIIAGSDALVVMPTGGGKSLCYQLPALLLEGTTIVVSPLIALMKDQVDALQRRGISATLINSSLSLPEQQERIRALSRGEYKLVYIAPERFRSRLFLDALGQSTIALFAVDEAHCLSMWGHDFRPDYFRLGQVLETLGRPQVAAFTATATPEVRRDILAHLALREPREFVAGFARPNLRLLIAHVATEAEKYRRLNALIAEHKTGIVYCSTRKRVEAVAETLGLANISSILYHGGMDDQAREKAQNAFMQGERDIVVATNAFGMGIDRADIRFVAHFDIPGSVEAYYQEAGRAGRDGEAATCELLFNHADTRVQEFFIEGSNPPPEFIAQTYEMLRREAGENHELQISIKEMAARVGDERSDMMISSALHILDREGYLDRFDIPGRRVRGTRLLQPDVRGHQLKLDVAKLREKERRDRAKLKLMVDFAYARECRQLAILRYFGEAEAAPCGNCDICLETSGSARPPTEEELLIVRKALSGVARMSVKIDGAWQPRFGRGRIVQTLVGSRSQEIINAQLDRLSTHGLLKTEGVAYLNQLLRELQEAGLLVSSGGEYPMVTLTPRGDEAMKGNAEYQLRWPSRAAGERNAPRRARVKESSLDEMLPVDSAILDRLKKLRLDLAREHGNVPAYVIFPDETLRAFARLKPTSVEAGRKIRGVGDVKARRYLPAFIEAIATTTN
ncbi:MAG TPA: RecQ family ATP-dependent DNA helicase [Chthoniobacterales bacterium]|jgi:ATP-dependent DNA helicase RecQ|nr:RecQ family ATP-dependent DNA helicase [Chthoniobacterales bacterium]